MNYEKTKDLNSDELKIFHAYKENQLYHFNEPDDGIFIAESPVVIKRALDAGYEPISFLVEKEQLNEQIENMISVTDSPVYVCPYDELKNLVGYHMSRGLLCAFSRKPNPDIHKICENKTKIAVLENIMNPTNTGAIIRSAVAMGAEAIILTKGCADPLQRRASRVSMGNIFAVDWAYMDTHLVDMKLLKKIGYKTVSMALTDDSVFIDKINIPKDEKIAVILGTEGEGLDKQTIKNSDYVVKIPMQNGVDSLNVAAASAVAFWEIF